ncbi:MAG: lytic transglycosylase domain-containing protein [Alphaproteobacteria bacterium]|nr:lytic transglycosylase domain-containing protein [Alphaproteobacteria bacterium]
MIAFLRLLLRLSLPFILFTAGDGRANHCATYITQHEEKHNIPQGLLHAISKVESGRKGPKGSIVAWPWTVNAQGKGYYFPSKDVAIAAVREMQRKGISSIDVGCMQVNLHHHPKAFANLESAFDPAQNVAYAARFLTSLKKEHASWHKAVAHYHSANPLHHIPYQKNVMQAWKKNPKMGALVLAQGRFKDRGTINHIRRLSSTKTLSLQNAPILQTSARMEVRRVAPHTSSRHIRKLSSR